jgi:hypothetical protein
MFNVAKNMNKQRRPFPMKKNWKRKQQWREHELHCPSPNLYLSQASTSTTITNKSKIYN